MAQYLLYALGLWVALKLALFLYLWGQHLRHRTRLPQRAIVPQVIFPADLEPLSGALEETLATLGLHSSHSETADDYDARNSTPQVNRVYVHPESSTYVTVSPSPLSAHLPMLDITMVSIFADGTLLVTTNAITPGVRLPEPSWCYRYYHTFEDVESLWRLHQQHVQKIAPDKVAMTLTPEELVEHDRRLDSATVALLCATGWLLPTRQAARWRFHPLRIALLVRGAGRVYRQYITAVKAQARKPHASASVTAETELAAFERWSTTRQRNPWGWTTKSVLFLGSIVVFAMAFGLTFSWSMVAMLTGVLLVHEGGHLVGMKLFRYRDVQVLFMPFLGALIWTPHETQGTPWQKLLVYLLGPVPGLLLGFGALYMALLTEQPVWLHIGILAVAVNYCNLLPIAPLDGGGIVETLVFARFPRAQWFFLLGSLVVLALAAWYMQHMVLGGAAILYAIQLPSQWHRAMAMRQVRRLLPPHADTQTRTQGVLQVLAQSPWRHRPSHERFQIAQSLLRRLAMPLPNWQTILGGGLVYVTLLALPAYVAYQGIFSSFLWTRLAPLVARLADDAEPDLEATLDYACTDSAMAFAQGAIPASAVSIIGTFATPLAAQEALTNVSHPASTAREVTRFGHSVFATVPDHHASARPGLQHMFQELGGSVLVEHPETEKVVRASLACSLQDAVAAALLAAELQFYFEAPASFYLRPPWAASPATSAVQEQAQQRARATYRTLLEHIEQLRNEAPYHHLGQESLRAGLRQDIAAIERTLQAIVAYEKTSQQLLTARLLQGHDPALDPAVVALYQQRLQDKDQNEHAWGIKMGRHLGQLPLVDGEPQGEAALLTASAGYAQQHDDRLFIDFIVFNRTQVGLPALARYLCARGCTDIKYGLADFDTVRGD